MAGGTGNGAALAWSGDLTFTAEVSDIGTFDPSVPAIDNTHVTDVNYQQFIFGKIMEHGGVSLTITWDATKCTSIYNGAHGTRIIGKVGTLTITWPISNSGNTTKATLAGTGAFTSFPTPEISSNNKMSTTAIWQFDGGEGGTAPTWTNEAA